jgi:hypothetical protein
MVHRPHSIPQYPSKQACGSAAGVARSCHAPQQNTWLLDYFVGSNLQCERNCEPQSLCCFQVDD